MKKILFVAACLVATACSNSTPVNGEVENDTIDTVEIVDSVVTDTLIIDSI